MAYKRITLKQISIYSIADVHMANIEVDEIVQEMGFGKSHKAMIVTSVSELSRNICAMAGEGTITVNKLRNTNTNKEGVEIVAEDHGPGIKNIKEALQDGFSTKATLGLGLPSVRRLMDEFEIDTRRKIGTKVTARKWLAAEVNNLDYFMLIKPLISERECGDGGVILEFDQRIFVALLDVLGHGKEAHDLCIIAKEFIEDNAQKDLVEIMQKLNQRVNGSRGLVACLMNLNCQTGILDSVVIGNIAARKFGLNYQRIEGRLGIVGQNMPKPRLQTAKLDNNDVLMVYSDGIKENFSLEDCPDVLNENNDAENITENIIRRFGKTNDDASCFVLRYIHDN